MTFDGNIAGDSETNIFGDIRFGYRISDLNNIWFGYRYLRIGNDTEEDGLSFSLVKGSPVSYARRRRAYKPDRPYLRTG